MSFDYPGGPDGPPADDDLPGPSPKFLAGMALAQTPEQQAIAREIYRRLEEGAEVDDIKPLIEEQMRVVVAQRNGRPVPAPRSAEQAGPTGVVGGPARRHDAWGDGPGSGLGARPEEDRRGR
ncbi:hypothetical protein [Actinacidiphila acididurans]|uniref:Uncharacterized protein n=1 Tax=Actinacidiphila acididurans TaxID=2784346 RepID=A0ABS2TKU2_9ACTN|nr:hypothetical protein [Actinacidiphila acididurans]MBM9503953.1 hypothetical protein [Actinacidiphila acididurans]